MLPKFRRVRTERQGEGREFTGMLPYERDRRAQALARRQPDSAALLVDAVTPDTKADKAILESLAKRQEAERKRREEEVRRQRIAESRRAASKTQQR